jgi:hypothetical protein
MRITVFICILLLLVGHALFSETIFLYVEENGHGEKLNFSVREGLFNGLFERDHIVFDDVRAGARIEWEKKDFKGLIDSAAEGGARYLIAVRVTSQVYPLGDTPASIKSFARYYCVEVRKETLVGEGELMQDNLGREEQIGGEALSLLLGEELSIVVDGIFQRHIAKL